MIYYYSATGNTHYAANFLGEVLNETAVNILETVAFDKTEHEQETLGIMFPIYCWGIPPVVKAFIESLENKISPDTYIWSICTCGDEAGTAMRTLDKMFERKCNRKFNLLASLQMPNTYVLLPGFDVDAPEVEKRKLDEAPGRLLQLCALIKSRKNGIYDVVQGSFPFLRSMLFPVFEKWGINTGWWRVSQECISCGKCAGICPARNITMIDGYPSWGRNCFSCCACFHICPKKAIAYGKITKNKSQYICPLKD